MSDGRHWHRHHHVACLIATMELDEVNVTGGPVAVGCAFDDVDRMAAREARL